VHINVAAAGHHSKPAVDSVLQNVVRAGVGVVELEINRHALAAGERIRGSIQRAPVVVAGRLEHVLAGVGHNRRIQARIAPAQWVQRIEVVAELHRAGFDLAHPVAVGVIAEFGQRAQIGVRAVAGQPLPRLLFVLHPLNSGTMNKRLVLTITENLNQPTFLRA